MSPAGLELHGNTRRLRSRMRWLLPALALIAGSGERAVAQEPERAVALPPFIVEELAKGPPWRYAEAPGYEILSRCNDATTRRVVEIHQQLHELLAEILPPSLRLKLSVPRALILYDEELQPAASQEVIHRMIRNTPEPVDDGGGLTLPGGRGLRIAAPQRRYSFLPNLRLWDRDAMAVFMIVRRDDFDADRLSLTQDYISFLVKRRVPSLPPWFVSGFLALYQQTSYGGGELSVEPLEWVSALHTAALKKDPKTAPPVQPLLEFLAAQLPARDPAQTHDPIRAWQSQAALFVRWGLEADRHAHREAFWKFVDRSAVLGPSEALFTECFGLDPAAARDLVAAYLPAAVRRTLHFRPARKAKLAPLVLRNATDAHIARIKGDWERLEVPYVKGISEELAPKYLEQARRTLKRGYDRGERDPRLLAVMGLCEVDAGNDAGAREYLEAAAAIGPIRPRANLELARLRLAEYRAGTGAAAASLNVNQLAEVLKPLFAARTEEPPLPEVYELIADAWSHAEPVPTRGHLAVLDEGVRLFPRRLSLVLSAAELNHQHGYREQAVAFAEIVARLADNETMRDRAAKLQEALGSK